MSILESIDPQLFQDLESRESIFGARYRYNVLGLAEAAGIDVDGLFQHRYFDDTIGAVKELEEKYYPDAWMFGVGDDQDPVISYTVRCSNPAELALAYALRPEGVSAHIILEPEQLNDEISQKQ